MVEWLERRMESTVRYHLFPIVISFLGHEVVQQNCTASAHSISNKNNLYCGAWGINSLGPKSVSIDSLAAEPLYREAVIVHFSLVQGAACTGNWLIGLPSKLTVTLSSYNFHFHLAEMSCLWLKFHFFVIDVKYNDTSRVSNSQTSGLQLGATKGPLIFLNILPTFLNYPCCVEYLQKTC